MMELEVKQSKIMGAGRGLFAKSAIPRGSNLGEYTGIVLPKGVDFTDDEATYALELSNGTSIIPHPSNPLRYANDIVDWGETMSSKHIRTHWYLRHNAAIMENKEGDRAIFVALKDISPGDEIYVAYGDGYWE